jgi:hypothetical protein
MTEPAASHRRRRSATSTSVSLPEGRVRVAREGADLATECGVSETVKAADLSECWPRW